MAETVRRLKVNRRYAGAGCAWCGDAMVLGEEGAVCEACEAVHHARCWDERNGCNGDTLCVNRPLQQIPEMQQQPTRVRKRPLMADESYCPSCGDITGGFCLRCSQTAESRLDYTGPRKTAEEAKEALKYAIAGLFCCSLFGVVALIIGVVALIKGSEAKRRIAIDPSLDGEGLATVAQVLGAIEILLIIFYILGILGGRR